MSTMFEKFMANVRTNPDKLVVWTEMGSATNRELYDYAKRAAATLKHSLFPSG